MMNANVVVGLWLTLSILSPSLARAEHKTPESTPNRTEAKDKKLPDQYGELDKILKIENTSEILVESTAFDDKDKKIKWGLKNASVDKAPKESSLKDMLSSLEKMKKYREALVSGKWCEADKSASKLADTLDAYVQFLTDSIGTNRSLVSEISEKKVNAYTVTIKKFLKEKAEGFDSQKKSFEKSDKELSGALDAIASVLWKGNFREAKFNQDFTWDKLKEDEDTKEITSMVQAARDELAKFKEKTDLKLCKLDPDSTVDDKGKEDKTKTEEEKKPIDDKGKKNDLDKPAPSEGSAAIDPGVSDTGATGPATPAAPVTPAATPGATGGTPGAPGTPGLGLGGADPSALAAQQRLFEDLQRKNLLDEQRQAELDAQNQRLLEAALANANQIQPPNNRSNSKENSEQGPQISPSVGDLGGKGGQQQPFQPPQFPTMPTPPPFQLPPPPTIPTIPLMETKNWNEDAPKSQPVPDMRTQELIEQLKAQNDFMRQQMGMGMNPYMNPYMNQQQMAGMPTNINRINGGAFARGARSRGVQTANRRGGGLPGRTSAVSQRTSLKRAAVSGGRVMRGTGTSGVIDKLARSPKSRTSVPRLR